MIDAHFHVFDPRFPLPGHDGFVPEAFTVADYLAQARPLGVTGGVLVAASTHGLDPAPILAALQELGPGFIAVLNADPALDDAALRRLAAASVRGLRHNLYRGMGPLDAALDLAERARDAAGLHAQIYADAAALAPALPRLRRLAPWLVLDHLGMTEAGLPVVLDLVAAGAKVKATGFGRVELDVPDALARIAAIRADALMFGTDLPSTRARRPFEAADIALLRDAVGPERATLALAGNARAFYRL
ncbi:amidohydrolase family protein [Falsiroseomonas oryziterrae]|uniref:amidohydrolase family protein n=1 Tax=Falsiroseomonas oryziterrae TaxID=2911368 RepID=UPI001F191AA1|nr:amidohydrolase family protein [Roseomonas sp. NPKOSM-4]